MTFEASYCLFDTTLGPFGIAWNERGLTWLQLPEADRDTTEQRLSAGASPGEPPQSVQQAIDRIRRYLGGETVDFASLAIDLAGVGEFRRAVYETARSIGWGETASYGELAHRIGFPWGARAVGQALARNPIPIIVPCHRILARDRRVGGFSAYGGAVTKQRLLALEGVALRAAPVSPGSRGPDRPPAEAAG